MGKSEGAEEKRRLERAARLCELAAELHAKITETLTELQKVLAGEAAFGEQLRAFEGTYQTAWSARYQGRYAWQYTKDRPQIKRLIRLVGLEELQTRAVEYLADADPYLLKARHPFALFVSTVNRYARASHVAEVLAPPGDCRHTPTCRTDQEHTRRLQAELAR